MSIYESLLREIRALLIVDAHEHLAPEKVRLSLKPDVCFLFSHYTVNDLISAGCRPWGITARERWKLIDFLRNTSIPLEERFKVIEPYIKYIKYGTYYRALKIALKEVYGYDEVNWSNYKEISDKMKEENKPGIYDKILVEKCRAKYVLPQWSELDFEKKYMRPVVWVNKLAEIKDFTGLKIKCREEGFDVRSLDDYLNYLDFKLDQWKKRGVVGLKTVSMPYREPPSFDKADRVFRKGLTSFPLDSSERDLLFIFIREKLIELAGKKDLVVAVHAGVWDDFRQLDPRHNIPLFQKYPETKFDLYHMGMPWVRDTAFIAKNYHNVYLNLCWSHIVSSHMTVSGLLEYFDIVPINKIIAFGGDYLVYSFEKVVGHLRIAEENIAQVLSKLVEEKRISSLNEALEVARMLFYENPVKIYGLE
ncbi:MAG: hypothetical protein DRJ63_08965 [Thermoprotei archaeon]|nr:MAG: hypothetical protein DRJ63_08965 [Thermoprotei archaeon]